MWKLTCFAHIAYQIEQNVSQSGSLQVRGDLGAELASQGETLPDQTGRPTRRITMRRVFQVFGGIDDLLRTANGGQQRLILNLSSLHRRNLNRTRGTCSKCYLQHAQAAYKVMSKTG
jgi:hypothetical protein